MKFPYKAIHRVISHAGTWTTVDSTPEKLVIEKIAEMRLANVIGHSHDRKYALVRRPRRMVYAAPMSEIEATE
jgi:hypothetical protein